MKSRTSSQQLLALPHGEGPLYLKLYQRIRSLILSGAWPPGTRLPSSRMIARDLRVSRNTAIMALDHLIADGWIIARPGSGMSVSMEAPSERPPASADPPPTPLAPAGPVPFQISQAGVDLFPVARWARLQGAVWNKEGMHALYEGSGAGWRPLRQAVAAYLHAVRGLQCSAEQVIILTSSQSAIDLIVRVLAEPDDEIWVEDPGYPEARLAFEANGLTQVSVPVDSFGLDVAVGRQRAPKARFAYVTSACQFPTCATLSPERRQELLNWSMERERFIIEDDWDYNARFDGRHAPEPLAQSGQGLVLYVHSFNRLLFPALRIAALVVPESLVDRFVEARWLIDGYTNTANQMTLAEFFQRGYFASHLRRCRDAYEERRRALHESLAEHMGGLLRVDPEQSGLHTLAYLDRPDDSAIAAKARRKGIACLGLSDLTEGRFDGPSALILGFAAFQPDALRRAVKDLAAAVND